MARAKNEGGKNGGGPAVLPPSPLHDISRPVSRVLYGGGFAARANSPRDGHSSGTPVTRRLQQPTRTADRGHMIQASPCGEACAVPIRSCSRWGLPCRLRCRRRGALLPHLFTLTRPSAFFSLLRLRGRVGEGGGLFSVALSLRSGVVAHAFSRRTLSGTACPWSPDFPPVRPFGQCTSGRPAD